MEETGDNYSDVDWSDEAESSDDEVLKANQSEETLHIDVGQSSASKSDIKKRKRSIAVYDENDRETAIERHRKDLQCAFYRCLLVSKWCNHDLLAMTLISLLPNELMQTQHQERNSSFDYFCNIANWFKKAFRKHMDADLTAEEGRDGSSSEDLLKDVIPNRAGSAHQLNQLLISLLRSLGYEVRYVRAIDPCSFKPNGHGDLKTQAQLRAKTTLPGQNKQKAKWAKGVIQESEMTSAYVGSAAAKVNSVIDLSSDDLGVNEDQVISVKVMKEDIPKCWMEVYLQMPQQSSDANLDAIKKCEAKKLRQSKGRKKSTGEINDVEVDSQEPVDDVQDLVGRYVQVDLYNGGSKLGSTIDSPKSFEVFVRGKKPVSYVLAVDATGLVVDVTSRYSNNSLKTKKARMSDISWWDQLVADVSIRDTRRTHVTKFDTQQTQQLMKEQEEFKSEAMQEPLPSTLSGFKDHPLYILERDIKGDQCINPSNTNAVAGKFKEEMVYYRKYLETLKTRHQWRMAMRDVITREVLPSSDLHDADPTACQAKQHVNSDTICRDNSSSSNSRSSGDGLCSTSNDDDNDDDDIVLIEDRGKAVALREPIPAHKTVSRKRGDQEVQIELYGLWQTETYKVEPVRNGVIPVNKHGNVEVWDYNERLVPGGARLLPSSHAVKAAQSLGLPFAPAIVGFENKGSFTAPKLGGAVVLAEHYSLLVEAVGNIQNSKEEKAEEQRSTEILKRWAHLVSLVRARNRLKEQYGH